MNGWDTWKFGEGRENTTGGFHGCIYRSPSGNETVVACRGTASARDVTADVKLAIGWCPKQASAAYDLYKRAKNVFGKSVITLVGHSLGGGLCQVIAHWTKSRFVTFNAPPMGSTIQKTKVNPFTPQKALRAIKASFKDGAIGHNYRLKGDVVSSRRTSVLGHYGEVHTCFHPSANGPVSAHKMGNFLDLLQRSSQGFIDPFA